MSKLLKTSRGSIYYKAKRRKGEEGLEKKITEIFIMSRNNYGTRKIKAELSKSGIEASRRKISLIMKKNNLVSNYIKKKYKRIATKCNDEKTENILSREFKREKEFEVVVSDLTCVNIKGKWNYVCLLLDLYNREIIGYSAGENKDSTLVLKAFREVKVPLKCIEIFHTDRGSEFKNKEIDELLANCNIKRSLSKKGCLYDNAVAESNFKIFKTEFANNKEFKDLEDLELQLFDYVNWYNNIRIHGSLNYMSPKEYKHHVRRKIV